MSGEIINVTDADFEAQVINADGPVLVDYWAPWCGPCKMIGPMVDQLADENEGKATIGKVNIDEHQQLAVQFNVQSIPTLLIFKGGDVVEQAVGARSKADLQAMLDSHA